jgi:DNA-binding transcriptional MerR regulator
VAKSARRLAPGHDGAVATTDQGTDTPTLSAPADISVDEGYTIDQLEALSGVSARTIRFYRQSGLIDPPRRIGRHAFYAPEQLGRLRFIAALRSRGMGLDAVARQLGDPAGTRESFDLLLSIQDELLEPWIDDTSALVQGAEVLRLLGSPPPEALDELVASGLISPHESGQSGETAVYDVESVGVLELAAELTAIGIAPSVSMAAWCAMRQRIGEMADELVTIFAEDPDHGFADNDTAAEISEAFGQLRPVALRAVQLAFAHEIQRALGAYLALAVDADAIVPRRPTDATSS